MQTLARLAIANEKRLERPDARHHAESIKILQKFEQEERAMDKASDLGDAWLRSVGKAAAQQVGRTNQCTTGRSENIERSK